MGKRSRNCSSSLRPVVAGPGRGSVGVVSRVELEPGGVAWIGVAVREGDGAAPVDHLEVLGVEPDGDRAAAERSGDGVALGADGDGGVVVDLADGFLEDREASVGESDEEVALGEPGLLGDEPGRAVDATVGDLGRPRSGRGG